MERWAVTVTVKRLTDWQAMPMAVYGPFSWEEQQAFVDWVMGQPGSARVASFVLLPPPSGAAR